MNSMEKIETSLGETLREFRLKASMGIKAVGPIVGVSYSYLSKIENDIKKPSIGLIFKLCRLYEADPDYVIAKANALPPDVSNIIKTHGKEAFDLLRSTYPEGE